MVKAWLRKHVRVEAESDAVSRHYGAFGIVTQVHEETKGVTVLTEKASFVVPLSEVAVRTERECLVRTWFNFSRVSPQKQTLMLHQLGYWDPESAPPIFSVAATRPKRLQDSHLRIWALALSVTFPKESFEIFDPQFFLRRVIGDAREADIAERLEMRIKEAFESKDLLLFPLQCPQMDDHEMGHWTLLAVQKKPQAVRYYEPLDEPNEICFSKALQVLSILGMGDQLEVTNKFRQISDECCECVMHYEELEVRHLAGEGWGSVKSLHPEHRLTIRTILKRFSDNMERFRKAWMGDEAEERVKREALKSWAEDKVGKAALAQVEIDKLQKIAEAVAELSSEHKDMPGLILPTPKPKPKLKAKVAQVKDKQVKQAHEGKPGSSGSSVETGSAPEDKQKLDKYMKKGLHPELQTVISEAGEPGVAGSGEPGEGGEPSGEPGEPCESGEGADGSPPCEEPGGEPCEAQAKQDEVVPAVSQPGSASEPQPAAAFSAAVSEQVKAAEAACEAKEQLELVDLFSDDESVLEKMDELEQGEKKFEAWVRDLTSAQKQLIIRRHFSSSEEWDQIWRYLGYVRSTQTNQGCGKCRFNSCEKCCWDKSLNYVLRHGSVPFWWKKYRRGCLQQASVSSKWLRELC